MSLWLLPKVILQYINDYLEYKDQIHFINSCKKLQSKIYLTDLFVPLYLSNKITDDFISKHPKLLKLNLYDNMLVSNLQFHKSITHLDISGSNNINQYNINHMEDLIYLNISHNVGIYSIDKFKKLEILEINGYCSVPMDQIKKRLNLKVIYD